MSSITLYTVNILEAGSVTVTGTPDTGYPAARLYDRVIGLFWKRTATGAITFQVDQGSDVQDIDTLIIDKHNFSGEDMTLDHSPDGSAWTNAASWTQADNLQIVKSLSAPVSAKFWRVTLTSLTDPQCSEIFLSCGLSFSVRANPAPSAVDVPNVQWNRTVGGIERSTKFGDARRTRQYLISLTLAELVLFRAAVADLDNYSRPFYFADHEGTVFLCRFQEEPQEGFSNKTKTQIPISIIEML